jgi:hypothetical protein
LQNWKQNVTVSTKPSQPYKVAVSGQQAMDGGAADFRLRRASESAMV